MNLNNQAGSEKVRHFVVRLREKYLAAYAKALSAGRQGLEKVEHLKSTLPSAVKQVTEDKRKAAHNVLDGVNRTLVEKAIPRDRMYSGVEDKDRADAKPSAPEK